VIAADVIP